LGLTFGSLIDYGVSSLLNAGYCIAGAIEDAIYLSNVTQFGVLWPEVTMYYGNSGMSGARFQFGSYSPGMTRYNSVYQTLCNSYGSPVSMSRQSGIVSATWWGGNNSGYVTLSYGPGMTETGGTMYYTDLIYGD
jgi:hypothetical protein